MNTTETINSLLQVLADRGLSDDAIINVRDGLLAQANETFMDQMLSSLTDEDLQQVEACATQEEADQKFAQIYHEKTGKDMQDEMNAIVDQYANDLISKYKMDDGVLPPVSYSEDAGDSHKEDKFFPSDDMIPPLPPPTEETDKKEEEIHELS